MKQDDHLICYKTVTMTFKKGKENAENIIGNNKPGAFNEPDKTEWGTISSTLAK
jgi:hypothetical protein